MKTGENVFIPYWLIALLIFVPLIAYMDSFLFYNGNKVFILILLCFLETAIFISGFIVGSIGNRK